MVPPSRHIIDDLTKTSVYKKLKGNLYFPYYLSGPKVETLFAQLWGDIKGFSKTRSTELSTVLGIEAETSGLFSWLARLATSARIGGSREWALETDYDVPDLTRFIILHHFLIEDGRVSTLSELSETERDTPHLFVEYDGPFTCAVDTDEIRVLITGAALKEISRRKKFEETAERDQHFLFVIPGQPKAIAIIANRYLSHFGHRYLAHYSEKRSINFFGATIGEAKGLLFLDPIAIGYRHVESNVKSSATVVL